MEFEQAMPNKAGIQWLSTFSPVYFCNQPEGHLWSKELTQKYFQGLKKTLREDLFMHGKHIDQSEIYSNKEFIGIEPF